MLYLRQLFVATVRFFMIIMMSNIIQFLTLLFLILLTKDECKANSNHTLTLWRSFQFSFVEIPSYGNYKSGRKLLLQLNTCKQYASSKSLPDSHLYFTHANYCSSKPNHFQLHNEPNNLPLLIFYRTMIFSF